MTSPAPAFRRVDLPALLFPPSPPQSRSTVAGPSQIRLSNLSSQHSSLGTTRSVTSDSGDDVEDLLSFQEAQVHAKGKLRSVICLWRDSEDRDCGAVLASVDFLEQHLDRHVRAYANNLDQNEDPYVLEKTEDHGQNQDEEQQARRLRDESLGIRCHWDRCLHHVGSPDYNRLLDHIKTAHIGKLVKDHCPHKYCIGRPLSDTTATHALRAHPGLWTEDRLRSETPQPHPISPVRQLRPLPTQIVPWLLSCHLIRPKAKSAGPLSSPPRSGRRIAALRSRAQSETSTVSDKVWPVMNERDPNDYWPMNGEAEPLSLGGNSSSSIFPPVVRSTVTDNADPIQRLRRWAGRDASMALKIGKKPALARRPRLFTGMDIFARAQRAELAARSQEAKEKVTVGSDQAKAEDPAAAAAPTPTVDSKSKRKAEGDLHEERQQYSVDEITHASAKRAARVTGRTIGYEYFEEMVAFETRGIELGELPPNHSFRK